MSNSSYMPARDDELSPCPFCGVGDSRLMEIDFGQWAAVCKICGCTGPLGKDPARAANNWNLRLDVERNRGVVEQSV